jgi:hypothetical protein
MNHFIENYSTKIKDILIELPDYQFFHSPSGINKTDSRFIGRTKVMNRLKSMLLHSKSKSGVYLVTGFRGMGKTSLVRLTLNKLKGQFRKELRGKKEKEDKVLKSPFRSKVAIEINLIQDDIQDRDILILITKSMLNAFNYTVKEDALFLEKQGYNSIYSTLGNSYDIKEEMSIEEEIYNLFDAPIQRLQSLIDSINFELTLERNNGNFIEIVKEKSSSENQNKNSFNRQNSKNDKSISSYPIANAKEIEYELIQILKDIDDIIINEKENKYHPEFVFIFDELDKVVINYNSSISDKQAEDPLAFDIERGSIFTTDSVRKRQETITRLLANLKHFFNVARAKFIFIAGREMFDASLADISDRNSFLSSIFHDVIYVDSFLKDKSYSQSAGITDMTEHYVCQLLIPNFKENGNAGSDISAFFDKPSSLHLYYKYLKILYFFPKNIEVNKENNLSTKEIEDILSERLGHEEEKAIRKIIYTIQNFIIYLTYRSNGTPKKITNLFEEFIVSYSREELKQEKSRLIINHENGVNDKLFLKLSYNAQYKFGFTTYLFQPYLVAHSRYTRSFGDKLLVATSYLMDHIFKYHSFAFSWRNFELTPEIIAVNKAPELRQFIEELIKFLSFFHIREIQFGLYEFKFFNRIANEITLISKTSELESAAFNFTLDESLLIKRHYRKKLQELKKSNNYGNYKNHEYIQSIGFVNNLLGDLHFYDQEYDDAFIQYAESAQYLKYSENTTIREFILLIKNKLKLALTLEKMKSYDSALAIYNELINNILSFIKDKKASLLHDKPQYPVLLKYIMQPFIARLYTIEHNSNIGVSYDNIINNRKLLVLNIIKEIPSSNTFLLLSNYYMNIGSLLFFKNSNLPNQLIELKERDVSLHNEIYEHLKNRIKKDKKSKENEASFKAPISAYVKYRKSLIVIVEELLQRKHKQSSFSSFITGEEKIIVELLNYITSTPNELNHSSSRSELKITIANILSKMGDCTLSFISDTENVSQVRFSFLEKAVDFKYKDLDALKKGFKDMFKSVKRNNRNNYFSINQSIFFYRLSALFYMKGGLTSNYLFQLKKILQIVQDYLSSNAIRNYEGIEKGYKKDNIQYLSLEEKKTIIDKLSGLSSKIIRAMSWCYDVTDRPQILKYRDIFNEPSLTKPSIFGNISMFPDTKEIILLLAQIKVKYGFLFPIKNNLINPYTSVSDKLIRVMELNFKTQVNFQYFERLLLKELFEGLYQVYKSFGDDEKKGLRNEIGTIIEIYFKGLITKTDKQVPQILSEALNEYKSDSHPEFKNRINTLAEEIKKELEKKSNKEKYKNTFSELLKKAYPNEEIHLENITQDFITFLISDSIFCLYEIVKSLKLYGLSYMASYSYLAYSYKKLGDWSKFNFIYQMYEKTTEKKIINEKIKNLIGLNGTYYIEANHYYELAIQNFYSCIEAHTEGNAYQLLISNMFYLEDDFNDSLYHFCAALERYKVNTAKIQKNINELKEELENASLYKPRSYYGDAINSFLDIEGLM